MVIRRVEPDEEVVENEIQSILNYIINEIEYEVNGSYLIESSPEIKLQVYTRLRTILKNKLKNSIGDLNGCEG